MVRYSNDNNKSLQYLEKILSGIKATILKQ